MARPLLLDREAGCSAFGEDDPEHRKSLELRRMAIQRTTIMTTTEKGPSRRLGNKGFTALELLVVMVMAVILVAAGMPSLVGIMQRSRLDGAAREVMSEIREVQSLAVSRGGVWGFHWGGDPLTGKTISEYRIEKDTTSACGFPPPTDTTGNPDVLTEWLDLSRDFSGVTISSIQDSNGTALGGVMFNSLGASVNTCTAVTFPVTITVVDGGGATRTIQAQRTGSVRIQ